MRFGNLDRSPRLSPRGLPGRCPVHDASTAPGRELSRQIAEAGKEWYSRAFRQVDLTIYTYRLLLEMARLQHPLREAGSG